LIHLGERFGRNDSAATVEELATVAELSKTTVNRALRELLLTERVTVSGKGVRGDPRRYQGLGKDSDQTPSPNGRNESKGPVAA
jgi:hypothetical protein